VLALLAVPPWVDQSNDSGFQWSDLFSAVGGLASLAAVLIAVVGLQQARKAGAEIERARNRDRLEARLDALEEAAALISGIKIKASLTGDTVGLRELQSRLMIVSARGRLVDEMDVVEELIDHPFSNAPDEQKRITELCDRCLTLAHEAIKKYRDELEELFK
jgi:hypothetical protein